MQLITSYRQFIKHLACDKQMPTFTYVKVTQMQRKHTLKSTHINICNKKTHIVELQTNPQIPIRKLINQNRLLKQKFSNDMKFSDFNKAIATQIILTLKSSIIHQNPSSIHHNNH